MKPEEHARAAELFAAALDLPKTEREALLARAESGEPPAVLAEVRALLAADDEIATASEAAALDDAKTLPRAGAYRLLRKLGEGGMSTVYLAVRDDGELNRRAAVKLIRRELLTAELVRRFETERQILASLDHPSIASLFDAGRLADGAPFFVMEYIEGEPIDVYCDRHGLTLRERVELFRQVCSAVHYAHQNLVVHRDLKPSNLLVTELGHPKLLDFGIAKVLQPELLAHGSEPTAWWERRLTPEYASPEQLAGKPITTASDVYSLGVLLFKLLTGQLPFTFADQTPAEAEHLVLTVEPPRPSSMPSRGDEHIDGDLDAIVGMALRKEPQRRYASVEHLDQDLERYLLGHPVAARRGNRRYRVAKLLRRHRLATGLMLALLAMAGLAIAAHRVQSTHLAEQRAKASRERERALAVTSFIQRLFAIAEPSRPTGETLTTRGLLDGAVRHITIELAEQPETQADLLSSMGRVYLHLGLYEPARQVLEQGLAARRATRLVDDEGLAESLSALGALESEVGNFAAAESLQRRALTIRRGIFASDHPRIAESTLDLAEVLLNQGRDATAAELGREVLARGESQPSQLRARALHVVGQAAWSQGEAVRAELLLSEAVDLQRQLHGGYSRAVAETLNDLALAMRDQGRLDEARATFEEAARIARVELGERHVLRAVILNNQAGLDATLGDLGMAAARYRESLHIAASLLPSGSPRLAYPQLGLAETLCRSGEHQEGESLIRKALELWRRSSPPRSAMLRRAETLLASCRDLQRGGAAAEPWQGSPGAGQATPRSDGLVSELFPSAPGWCVPDGGFDDTLTRYSCCSGFAVTDTTTCTNPADHDTTWRTCSHVCGTRPVNGCIPSGGVDDTLHHTDCCSGKAIPGSTRCLDPADYGTTWRSCVQTCA